jgi:hypothetical protein
LSSQLEGCSGGRVGWSEREGREGRWGRWGGWEAATYTRQQLSILGMGGSNIHTTTAECSQLHKPNN